MATSQLFKFVRRYTTLSSAIDTLINRKLVLLSPSKWDDTNDISFMELYRAHKRVGSVLALCCTMSIETYHHWRVFTQGMEGVCLEFDRQQLTRALNAVPGIETGAMDYLNVRDLEALTPADAHRLPFLKRKGYRDEREWRILISCDDDAKQTFDVPVDPSSLVRIIFNPWLPPPLAENLRTLIRGLPDCSHVKIESSRLTNSERWKAAGKALVS